MNFNKLARLLFCEGNQQKYYHETSYTNLMSILRDDKFVLRNSLLKGAESRDSAIKKPYFMSLSRVPGNSYRDYPFVTLVLNGRLLNANYSIKPFDYWGPEFKKMGKSEAEERIFSENPVIPNANKYIEEIHVFVDKKEFNKPSTMLDVIRHLTFYKKDGPVKVYFYDDRKALYSLDKRKAINVSTDDITGDYMPYSRNNEKKLDYISSFLSFMESGKAESPKDQKDFRNLLRYPQDWVLGKESDFHNFYTNSSGGYGRHLNQRLVSLMKEDKVTTLRALLISRWKKLTGKTHIDYYFK